MFLLITDETTTNDFSDDQYQDQPNVDVFNENFVLLKDTLLALKAEKKRATRTNVVSHLAEKTICPQQAQEIIEISLERGIIVTYKYAGQLGYKLKNSAVISDPVEDVGTSTNDRSAAELTLPASIHVATNTNSAHDAPPLSTVINTSDYVKQSDFIEFQTNMMTEISKLQQPQHQHHQPPPQSVVTALSNHITFLQQTIATLISNKNTPTPPPFILPSPVIPPTLLQTALSSQKTQSGLPTNQTPPAEMPPRDSNLPPSPPQESPKPAKKQVLLTGDSMLNPIDEKELRRDAFVRVRNHPGATVEDMSDHLRAHTRNVKHDAIIFMAGQNDISRNIPSKQSAENLTKLIQQAKQSAAQNAHIAIMQVTARKDKKGIMNKVNELNREFRQVAQREQVGFVNTSFYQPEHCGIKGVHPNGKGVDILYETFEKYIRKISRD